MVVHTESEKVVETRKFLLELLFSERNHYCMYCQMSGDCELQSLAYRYELDSWLYPRPYTPLPVDATRQYFVVDHNRCILCRRCIRACAELVGNYTLGLSGRGAQTMIVADMDVPFGDSSCLSCGTCLEVCPTGALMDRRSAYRGREEEVEHTASTCTQCSVGCSVQLVSRDNHLLRVESDWEGEVNQGVLCVTGRFDCLSDSRRRALTPMVKVNGQLRPATWDEALTVVADRLRGMGGAVSAIASTRLTNEALGLFSDVMGRLGARSVSSLNPVPAFMAQAEGSIADLDEADLYVVVGEDLSVDHQVAGIAVRRGVMNRGARLVIVDDGENGMADVAHYVLKPDQLDRAIELAKGLDAPVVIYGAGAGDVIDRLREELGGKAQFLGLVPGSNARGAQAAGLNGRAELNGVRGVFVVAADDTLDDALLGSIDDAAFVVAQTAYEGPLWERADVVLPTGTWAEKSGTFTNTEGRTQPVQAALQAPHGVVSDQEILQALADKLG